MTALPLKRSSGTVTHTYKYTQTHNPQYSVCIYSLDKSSSSVFVFLLAVGMVYVCDVFRLCLFPRHISYCDTIMYTKFLSVMTTRFLIPRFTTSIPTSFVTPSPYQNWPSQRHTLFLENLTQNDVVQLIHTLHIH